MERAWERLQSIPESSTGRLVRTPIVRSAALSDLTGAEVFLKLESLQRTGSFKVRGAYNFVLSLSEAARRRGLVAASTGNHGAAVAYVARQLGLE
ncbi:MAG: pyridoxal-phosphate dependent enzyme, partial [Thermoplasmata archaeon]|nr:pyridoxal-phosphate dependent enzyme [Thermoplasmata archaeon]